MSGLAFSGMGAFCAAGVVACCAQRIARVHNTWASGNATAHTLRGSCVKRPLMFSEAEAVDGLQSMHLRLSDCHVRVKTARIHSLIETVCTQTRVLRHSVISPAVLGGDNAAYRSVLSFCLTAALSGEGRTRSLVVWAFLANRLRPPPPFFRMARYPPDQIYVPRPMGCLR